MIRVKPDIFPAHPVFTGGKIRNSAGEFARRCVPPAKKGLNMRLKTAVSLLVLSFAITGCNRSINSIAPSSPQRLPSAPVETVEQSQLPEPADSALTPAPTEATAPQAPSVAQPETQIAVNEPAPQPTGAPVTREGVSGAWIVASDNPNCRLILAFTKWSGGYRAAPKRCNSAELSSVTAWDVEGQQVKLMDNSGNTIARLYQSASERYDGTTNSGSPVSFTR
jgi:hypothetical protein